MPVAGCLHDHPVYPSATMPLTVADAIGIVSGFLRILTDALRFLGITLSALFSTPTYLMND